MLASNLESGVIPAYQIFILDYPFYLLYALIYIYFYWAQDILIKMT